jgi:hypothetical protein
VVFDEAPIDHVGVALKRPLEVCRNHVLRQSADRLPGAQIQLSKDLQFEEKFWDVVGLYLNPPDEALVKRQL